MHVTLLFNQIDSASSLDERDVLVQCDAVQDALQELGHAVSRLSLSLNLSDARDQLLRLKPDVVFNLVESVGGTDRLMPLATLMLEAMGIPYTGSTSQSLLQTSGKLAAKRCFQSANIPTASWLDAATGEWTGQIPTRAILKTVWEHSSFGIDDDCVVDCDVRSTDALMRELEHRAQTSKKQWFAEQFIDGREFNLSLLAGRKGPVVLPPAEIRFIDFPACKPRIVNYAAKWNEDAVEYHTTPRSFDFDHADDSLLHCLKELAERCWWHFELRGYARVDFRVDGSGTPWVLEINANPCLSPDAGFAAAITQSNMEYRQAINQILQDAHV